MATLQKIRSKGAILIIVIGLALFAFIAEEGVRSMQSHRNENRQRVGEVYGESISVQEFQAMIDEFSEVMKFTQGVNSLDESQLNQVKDNVWNTYVQNQLIAHEAKKLGLTVTDAELQAIINEGTNPLLMQTPFRNDKTGRFDAAQLKTFLQDYKSLGEKADQMPQEYMQYYQSLYKFWSFVERSLREQTLAQKYNTLLMGTFLSDPTSAQQAYDERSKESSALVAVLPYSRVEDKDITVDDKDLKAKWEEHKESYLMMQESRDIKYIDVPVAASQADKDELNKEVLEYAARIEAGEDAKMVVRESGSSVSYNSMAIAKDVYPRDIAAVLDSMSAGSVQGPFYTASDNTLNLVKLIAKVSMPDSVEYRSISVGAATIDEAHTRADSITAALKAGADFEAVAKIYGQDGKKQWMTGKMFEQVNTIYSEDDQKYVNTMMNAEVGTINNVKTTQGNIILNITARKDFKTKYNAAVIKKAQNFSPATYREAYNKFSQFIASNPDVESLEANAAKEGYRVVPQDFFQCAQHNVGGVGSTHDAIRWIFDDDTEAGDISPLYECGSANDHMLVIAVTGIHDKKYYEWDAEQVKAMLHQEVLRDKKAEKLLAEMNGKDFNAVCKMKGAQVDTIQHITFAAPAFIGTTGTSEPALSGAVARTADGQTAVGVKGNGGVFAVKVLSTKTTGEKINADREVVSCAQNSMQQASQMYMSELYRKAQVKDSRYLFF